MKFRILASIGVCFFLFTGGGIQFSSANVACSIQEDPEITELKEKENLTFQELIDEYFETDSISVAKNSNDLYELVNN